MAAQDASKVDHARLEALFLDVCDTLAELGVSYHLEGGTLLGLVRDGGLLPWDPDADVSIMREESARIGDICRSLKAKGWRTSIRHYGPDDAEYAKGNDIRMIKVKGRGPWYFLPDGTCCDIIVKTRSEGFVYWRAKGCTMRVSRHHYDGAEPVLWQGRTLPAPADARGYLTAKYGDWSVPVKEWSAVNEHTVIRRG